SEDTWHGFFARLRRDDPVHFCDSPLYGPYWSVTRYRDIMTVDTSHQTYSSDAAFGGITLKDVPLQYRKESFIAMDPPRHDEQRKIVAPIVAPPNLAKMSGTIRERAIRILEALPRGEVFDWVDRVSVELTTQMLSTLLDFPFEERRTLNPLVERGHCEYARGHGNRLGGKARHCLTRNSQLFLRSLENKAATSGKI